MLNRIPKAVKIVLLLAAVVAIASFMRNTLNIELNPAALRDMVLDIGPAAAVVCILLVMFRLFVGLPSHVALLIPGLCFGATLGTIYATIGLLGSGIMVFLIARYSGRDLIEASTSERYMALMRNMTGVSGAAALTALMAYPLTPLLPTQTVIGMTPMRFTLYLVTIFFAAIIRSACYSYFGDSLVSGAAQPILQATAIMVFVIGVPLLIPRSRAWLLQWIKANKAPEQAES